jgi:cathepsin C
MKAYTAIVMLIATVCAAGVAADTPANCSYSDFLGHWEVMVSTPGDKTINCLTTPITTVAGGITLKYPNIAIGDGGEPGNWTLIYNQGIEVWMGGDYGQIWFTFAAYNQTTSFCDRTQEGWVHWQDPNKFGWMCFSAKKSGSEPKPLERLILQDDAAPIVQHVSPAVKDSGYSFVSFGNNDETCTGPSAGTQFQPGQCFQIGTRSAIITFDKQQTNQYALSLWQSNVNCQGEAVSALYGQGDQCNPTNPSGLNNFRIVSPINTQCTVAEFYDVECSASHRNTFGFTPDQCVTPLDPNLSPYMWSLDQTGTQWTLTHYADSYCWSERESTNGSVGACGNGVYVQCQKETLVLPAEAAELEFDAERTYKHNPQFIEAINAAQSMWTAKHYEEHENYTLRDMQRRRGGKVSLRDALPPNAREKPQKSQSAPRNDIPTSFDWRNVSGVNYVSPIRDQGGCGSCYAFGSGAMMEARIRIASNMQKQPVISTQDVVSCSQYSQGCEGGFPYLVAGKYGRDYGLLEEACYPYVGSDSACTPDPQPGCNPQRWMTKEYYYIGGYYGMSTVELMQEEIMANGPIAVSFEVYDDFQAYSGGVYTHKFTKHLRDGLNFDPFELTNHVVSIVGWGQTTDSPPTPYWIVKNSWGASWGENGFFRILRGSSEPGGECAIESITVSAIPILH